MELWTNGWMDKRTQDLIPRCPRRTFQAGGINDMFVKYKCPQLQLWQIGYFKVTRSLTLMYFERDLRAYVTSYMYTYIFVG